MIISPVFPDWITPSLAALTAAVATLLLLVLLLKQAALLPLDHPNERSLHTRPTPRIGGLALFPGAILGCVVAGAMDADARLMLGLAGIVFVVSIADDLRGLPVVLRFGAHLLVAFALALVLLGPSPMALVAALAVAWMTNLYNFMDGTNGLAGGMAAIGFTSFGLASEAPGLSFALAGAALGFLVFNFDPARVFLGDAGSIPLGFLAGGLGLLGVVRGEWPWWFPLLVFSAFLVDATATLLRRLIRGEKVWNAHRDHYYQRLVRMGCSHRRLAQMAYALMAACGASALAMSRAGVTLQVLGLMTWALIYVVLLWLTERRWTSYNEKLTFGDTA